MEDYLREELIRRDYSFVYTPHIAKRELWQISGHEAELRRLDVCADYDLKKRSFGSSR